MRRRLLLGWLTLTFCTAASAQEPNTIGEIPVEPFTRFAEAVRKAAGEGVRVTVDGTRIHCALDAELQVPSAQAGYDRATRSFLVTLEGVPYLSEAAQRARVQTARRAERSTWKPVAKLECDGKEFSDVYQDGLCFRPKSEAQRRNVDAYRRARAALASIPLHHRGQDFAVVVHFEDGEPTDGRCGEPCSVLLQRLAALLTEYQSAKAQ